MNVLYVRGGLPWWLSGEESAKQEMLVQLLGGEDPLEQEMATHSSTLAWRIPWAEEPRGLVCMSAQSCWTLCDPMTAARQAPLSMGFSRPEYWSGVATSFYSLWVCTIVGQDLVTKPQQCVKGVWKRARSCSGSQYKPTSLCDRVTSYYSRSCSVFSFT